jgi:hypothetical protein
MTVQEAIQTLQNTSPEERIRTIELLLESLKDDLSAKDKPRQPFKVRTFNLGSDVQIDREQLYLERGL